MKMNKVFTSHVISNILLTFGIFFAVTLIVLFQFNMNTRNEQLDIATELMTEQQEWLDARVLDSELLMYNIMQLPEFLEISRMRAPYTGEELDKLRSMVLNLAIFSSSQSYLSNGTIFFEEAELFLNGNSVGTDPIIFYNSRRNEETESYEKWYDFVQSMDEIEITSENPYILYNSRYELMGNDILYFANFAENPYTHILEDSLLFSESVLYVFDEKNELLWHNGDEKILSELSKYDYNNAQNGNVLKLDSRNYYAINGEQQSVGVQYLWLLSEDVILAPMQETLRVLFITGTVLMLAFVITAVFMAYRGSRPIYKLLNKITSDNVALNIEYTDELEYISGTFDKIQNKNELLQQEINTHFETTKTIFFTKLLNGVSISGDEVRSASNLLADFFSHRFFCLILFDIKTEDTAVGTIPAMVMKSFISENVPEGSHVIQAQMHRYAIICAGDETLYLKTKEIVETLPINAEKELSSSLSYTLIIGNTCETPEHLAREYHIAAFTLDSLETEGQLYNNNILYSNDLKTTRKGYYYPLFEEQSIINCINGKKYEEARQTIKNLFNQNFFVNKLSQRERNHFIKHISNTFLRLIRSGGGYSTETEKHIEDLLYQINLIEDGASVCGYLTDIVDYLEKSDIDDTKNDRSQVIYEKTENLIKQKFNEVNFSINEISTSLKLSENYLSVIFRQHTGKSIASTIETTRLEYAALLLVSTDNIIKDICEDSGYGNLNTFYKAFKRYYGVTPSDYRKIQSQQQENDD